MDIIDSLCHLFLVAADRFSSNNYRSTRTILRSQAALISRLVSQLGGASVRNISPYKPASRLHGAAGMTGFCGDQEVVEVVFSAGSQGEMRESCREYRNYETDKKS